MPRRDDSDGDGDESYGDYDDESQVEDIPEDEELGDKPSRHSDDDNGEDNGEDKDSDNSDIVIDSEEDDEEDEEDDEDEDDTPLQKPEYSEVVCEDDNFTNVPQPEQKQRITLPHLYEMERIAIFSIRKQQIENGAQPCVDLSELTTLTTDEIIREEYRQNKIPIRIKRPLPNGTFEIWRLADFEIKPIIV